MSNEYYLPEADYLQKQSSTNNQGRSEVHPSTGLLHYEFNRIYDNAQIAYENLLNEELTKELARAVLPVANYTECIWKIDLHNFFHFVKLRADIHAQREIQDYANAMYELVKPKFPLCCEAFEDYDRDAVTFSKHEMEIIKDNLNNITATDRLSGREETEFLEKIKIGADNDTAD
jgi:thymidylate synthase (FAD)